MQGVEQMSEPVDEQTAVGGLVTLSGRRQEHHIGNVVGQLAQAGRIGQIGTQRRQRRRQCVGAAAQSVDAAAGRGELQACAQADVAAPGQQHGRVHATASTGGCACGGSSDGDAAFRRGR